MKIETKLRNEFLFEVRDAETGELKQTVKSHNIVLNQFFDKKGNRPETYYTDIMRTLYVGDGVGTLDPSRTTLFNQVATYTIGGKTITEKDNFIEIKGSVILGTNTLVGVEISEIGISKLVGVTISGINTTYHEVMGTHSLLKDMNGNPLTILKTDTDIVTIYVTIYAYFDGIPNMYDTVFPRGGLDRFLFLSIGSQTDRVVNGDFNSLYNKNLGYIQKSNINNIDIDKKISVSARIGPDVDTKGVTVLLSEGIGISSRHSAFDNYRVVSNETLGIGDDLTSIFRPKIDTFENISVFVDGILDSNYSILGRENNPLEWFILLDNDTSIRVINKSLGGINNSNTAQKANEDRTYIFTGTNYSSYSLKRIKINQTDITRHFKSIIFKNKNGDTLIVEGSELSTDGWITIPEGYESLDSITFKRTHYNVNTYVSDYELNQPYGIQFNTPPPEGAVITATYTTPRIPITPDNVLDIEITRTYNEYSG